MAIAFDKLCSLQENVHLLSNYSMYYKFNLLLKPYKTLTWQYCVLVFLSNTKASRECHTNIILV